LLTNGADEAIHLLCETYLDPGDEALIVVPTYSMYQIYAKASGATVIEVALESDFRLSISNVLSQISDRTRLIAIANPNNPTGTVVAEADLVLIARSAPSAAVLIDEAYFEFYGQSMLDLIGVNPNIFVARTFSKAYGMAGLRIGVLIGNADQVTFLR